MDGHHFIMGSLALFGFIVTYATVPLSRKAALKYQVVSMPGGRRTHVQPTPLLGGLAIFVPFALVFCTFFILAVTGWISLDQPKKMQMLSLFLGTTWMLILGTLDDKKDLGWGKKLGGQFLGVGILVLGGHNIATATVPLIGPVEFGWYGIPLFVLAVLAITNAINLIDGMDGLAGGICFFAALTSAVIGVVKGDVFTAVIGFTAAGSLLAFLIFNLPPASIFMGDGGAMMMGFLLGTLATSSAAISPGQRLGTSVMILIPFLPFGIPLFEVVLSIFRRLIRGQAVFLGDGDHLHHRLRGRFEDPRLSVGVFYFFSAALCALTLFALIGLDFALAKLVIAVIITVILIGIIGSIRLYNVDKLVVTLKNRPHFKFLGGFLRFMKYRMRRAESLHELLALLETGVRDLRFDRVEVVSDGHTTFKWTNPRLVHPNSPRIYSEESLDNGRIVVKWARPIHDDTIYNEYLMLTWYRFLAYIRQEVENHSEELTASRKGNVIELPSKQPPQT
ncbi:MAG TPA: MraY family glycosyltransferase [Desulfomonilaceae bacterium]|nr:MraY family glycosyltransferase [Desulfomonilaceae bacterium]